MLLRTLLLEIVEGPLLHANKRDQIADHPLGEWNQNNHGLARRSGADFQSQDLRQAGESPSSRPSQGT